MKKTNLLVLSVAAAMVATSCSKDQVSEVNPGNAIQFKAFAGATTKASETNTGNINDFAVTAYENATTPGAVFFTDTYSKTEGAEGAVSWRPTGSQHYWPTTGGLTFLGYSPATLVQAGNVVGFDGGTASMANATTASIVDVQPKTQAKYQADLLVFRNTGTSGAVDLYFQHALSQITVSAKNSSSSSMKVEVAGVKIANVMGKGTVTFPTGPTINGGAPMSIERWASTSLSTPTNYFAGETDTNPTNIAELGATASSLMGTDGSFMLIPQALTKWTTTATSGAYIAVLCRISQVVDATAETPEWKQIYPTTPGEFAYSVVGIGETWEPGKKYNYTLNFFGENGGGGNTEGGGDVVGGPISFTVTVNAWANGTNPTPDMPASGSTGGQA